jgi:hypothetical protein
MRENVYQNLVAISEDLQKQRLKMVNLEQKLGYVLIDLEHIECGEKTRYEIDQAIEKLQKIQTELF